MNQAKPKAKEWKLESDKRGHHILIPTRLNDLGQNVPHTLFTQCKAEAELLVKAPELAESFRIVCEKLAKVVKRAEASAESVCDWDEIVDARAALEKVGEL